ncbi:hypothetical protein BT96DRAFT_917149 [Gymnopus androsaceus JB14]|uniref:DUF6534 domain-containing protein n=1 Tax=Gymnopus androsaceus JB14 TaxID=1447944 RepID=A0A6A4I495_9AGAR|nr:hypothetical protein BT96DRAFT_917149 [Gymnopus androsaceus JB14]
MDLTYGSAFVGLIVSASLYGATILQTYLYYRNYPKDTRYIKILVFALWILDTTQLALSTTAMYWYLITNYNYPPALNHLNWSMELQTDCNGLIALLVECFFARRVWIMSSNVYLVAIIILLAVLHCVLGIVFTIDSFHLATTSQFGDLIWVTSLGIGSAAAADMIIAGALSFYLFKSRTGFKKTDSLISTLIAYSLTTGLVTSIIGLVIVISFVTLPTDYVWLAFFWIDGKCYVNSCLAALNSRESLRERAAPPEGSFLQLSQLPNSHVLNITRSTPSTHEPPPLAITVQTDTVFQTDSLDSPSSIVKHKISSISATSGCV